jgi:hypothetical protein
MKNTTAELRRQIRDLRGYKVFHQNMQDYFRMFPEVKDHFQLWNFMRFFPQPPPPKPSHRAAA